MASLNAGDDYQGRIIVAQVGKKGARGAAYETQDGSIIKVFKPSLKPGPIKKEAENQEKVAKTGYAPKVISYDPENRYIEMERAIGVCIMDAAKERKVGDELKPFDLELQREILRAFQAIDSCGFSYDDGQPLNIFVDVETEQVQVIDYGATRAKGVGLNDSRKTLMSALTNMASEHVAFLVPHLASYLAMLLKPLTDNYVNFLTTHKSPYKLSRSKVEALAKEFNDGTFDPIEGEEAAEETEEPVKESETTEETKAETAPEEQVEVEETVVVQTKTMRLPGLPQEEPPVVANAGAGVPKVAVRKPVILPGLRNITPTVARASNESAATLSQESPQTTTSRDETGSVRLSNRPPIRDTSNIRKMTEAFRPSPSKESIISRGTAKSTPTKKEKGEPTTLEEMTVDRLREMAVELKLNPTPKNCLIGLIRLHQRTTGN